VVRQRIGREVEMVGLLWLVFLVLLVLWIIGFAVNWGAFVWILLAVALIILIGNLISGAFFRRWY